VHMHSLLSESLFDRVIEDVKRVFACMMAETLFRESPPPSLESYLKIRTRTIGISPFFTLAEGALCRGIGERAQNSEILNELKELINEIIGLQNGLDKDLRENETMNVVVVLGYLRKTSSRTMEKEEAILRECVAEAEKMHTNAVERATTIWRAIHTARTKSHEKDLSDAMMTFTERHLKWSMACQRYKIGNVTS